MLDEKVYQDIVRRINQRYRRRALFLCHMMLYVVMGIPGGFRDPYIWGPWLFVVVLHFALVILYELRDRAVRREVQRELEHTRAYTLDSDFVQRHARLDSDDAVERFQVVDDEWDRKRKHV